MISVKGAYALNVVQRGHDFFVIAVPDSVARLHGYDTYEGGPYSSEAEANGKRDQVIEAILRAIPNVKVQDGN